MHLSLSFLMDTRHFPPVGNTPEYSTYTSMMQHVLHLTAAVAHKQMKQPLQHGTLIVIATAEADRQCYIDHLLGTSGYYVVHIISEPCTSIYCFFHLKRL